MKDTTETLIFLLVILLIGFIMAVNAGALIVCAYKNW